MDYQVKHFEATGGGSIADGTRIQQAIDTCAEAGGGRVVITSGRYEIGVLRLRSAVELEVQAGAILSPSDSQNCSVIITADSCENIRLAGPGKIEGSVTLINCQDVTISGLTMSSEAEEHSLYLENCQSVELSHLKIHSLKSSQFNCGILLDGCSRLRITNCDICTTADALSFTNTCKSTCGDSVVGHCIFSSQQTAIRIDPCGGGSIRNLIISNCIIADSNGGLGMFVSDGGILENIRLSNIVMDCRAATPLHIDHSAETESFTAPGAIRDIRLENIGITGPGKVVIEGMESSPMENIIIRDMTFTLRSAQSATTGNQPLRSSKALTSLNKHSFINEPYQLIISHMRFCEMSGLRFFDHRGRSSFADRGDIYLYNVRASRVAYRSTILTQHGQPSVHQEQCHKLRLRNAGSVSGSDIM